MSTTTVNTADLFCASYLLTQSAELIDLRIARGKGKPVAWFTLTGKNIQRLEQTYLSGQAIANIIALKTSMNFLRDRMFAALDRRKAV